jgi:hypothetical protein
MNSQYPGDDRPTEDLVREIEAVLGRRVDALERENARLRARSHLLSLGVVAALALAAGVAALTRVERTGTADTVQARQFVLRDAGGNARAVLANTAEGGARLTLLDHSGQDRLRMTLLADGSPGLSFADAAGRSRAVLGFLPDETANLVFADRTGRTRAVFGLMPDESSTLVFADRNGETRVGIGVDPYGDAGLTVFEREGATTPPTPVLDLDADTTAANGTPPGRR